MGFISTTTLTVLGQLPSTNIAPRPNSNANPKPNPNPDREAICLGGNCPDTDINTINLNGYC